MIALRKSIGLAAALGLALTLSACSSSTDTATDSASATASPASTATSSAGAANEAFCTSAAALKAELADLRSLVTGGSLTVDALQAQRAELSAAGDQVKADTQSLAAEVQAQVVAAQTAFQTAVDAIPADATGVKEAAAYAAAAAVFVTALDAIDVQAGCS